MRVLADRSSAKMEETVVDVPDNNLSMSRREKADISIYLDRVQNLKVTDEWGRKIAFGDIYKDQKTIVIFLRHFLCFMCKEYVDDLALIPEHYLKDANVKLALIGCGARKFIEPFRRATGYKGTLFVDPERELYKKIGCFEKGKADNLENVKASRHIKSGFVMGILKSTWRGMQYRELQGDVDQQGGEFIFGPGNAIHFKHLDQLPSDHTSINDLLAAAGVHQVNFAKDTRVMTL